MLFSISSICVPAYAAEGDGSLDIDQLKYSAPVISSGVPSSAKKEYDSVTYYGDGKELYSQLRDAMDKRKGTVKLHYYNSLSYISKFIIVQKVKNMMRYAWSDELSVSSTDGDYIHWSVSEADYEYTAHKSKYVDLTLTFGYYTTSQQEILINKEVDNIVSFIRKKNWSDYDIVKYVHDEICTRTTYDYDALKRPNKHYHAYSAYGALVGGEVVCQGYSLAFYRICRELGYDVRLVYSDTHGWNIIKLDGKAYYVDCTWDDDIWDNDEWKNDKDIKGNHYYFFLVSYDTLKSLDEYGYAHSIDPEQETDEHFIANYLDYEAEEDYDASNMTTLSACSESISYSSVVYNGEANYPSVIVKDPYGTPLVKGKDYSVSYSSNTNCGRAVVTIKGMGQYAGMSSRRTFVIRPAKMTKPKISSSGRTQDSLAIEWSKPSGSVSGYQLQMYRDGEWVAVYTTTSSNTLSYSVKGLTAGKKYQFRVRAYKTIGKMKYYGEPSSTYITYTLPKTPSSLTLSTKSKTIIAKWGKVSCSGYEIAYSTSSNMANQKTVLASNTAVSKNIKSLKSGKKYYVRIRSYRKATINGKSYTYYSKWSSKKSITVK